MAPVSKAKNAYTRTKKALIRQLDPVPALLSDYSVGKQKLEDVRGRCVTAWDTFTVAYVELADLQSEEEVQDPEERDQEYADLETRYHDLVDSLAETVLQRGIQAETERAQRQEQKDEERAQREKQEERERVQQEK